MLTLAWDGGIMYLQGKEREDNKNEKRILHGTGHRNRKQCGTATSL